VSTLVSVVVPTYGRPGALARCLDSIADTVRVPHEVVCVSVAGDEATAEVLAGRAVRHLEQERRGGFVEALNMGLRAAEGTYVTQINDDCMLMPYTIENAVRFLEAPAHDTVALAAFFHDSPVRRNVFAQIQVEGTWYYVCHVRGLCYANFGLARRGLYEQLGYCDDRYFMYGADPDFSLKVWHEAKREVRPCPGALVHHEELDDDRARSERAEQDEDNRKLFEKWGLS
jgi:GT2 family glycosyltransferase